jgi:carboxypeptidase family protein/TonB-dependent receptor-like protein
MKVPRVRQFAMQTIGRMLVLLFVLCAPVRDAVAQTAPAPSPAAVGVISGTVTTQKGTIRLGGAQVTIHDASDAAVATLLSEGDGQFRFVALPPGAYRIVVSLDGFDTATTQAIVTADKAVDVAIDLSISTIAQVVDVVGTASVVTNEGTLAATDSVESKERDQYTPGGGFQGALRLLASIITVPSGVSIKGGRPSQASVQVGSSTLVNPTTGLAQVSLPDDAIDTVAVLPNPYSVEYGRFSSGLVVIRTRRAGDAWRLRLNNVDPTFRTTRSGSPFSVKGIGVFAPRVETGGPIIASRLFVEQTAQYRYTASDVASRPEDELRTAKMFSSFTRADANLTPRHSLAVTAGVFPRRASQDTLGTFTPPGATVDIDSNAGQFAITERALWTDTSFTETTMQVYGYRTDVMPQGFAPMELRPETTLGNFYNRQHRGTSGFQIVQSLSGSRQTWSGLHLYKIGVDLLRSDFDGSSRSQSVLIERSDGSLARRLDFPLLATQSIERTDVAVFVQDRVQPNTRWFVEVGGRLDRDGVAGRFNPTPRVGTAVLLNESGSAVLRGGFGLFYERTPLTAGAFDQFESAVDSRFAADGVTLLAPPVRFVHETSTLETPRSRTWDVGYDYRVNPRWSFHVGALDRRGSHELIVDPLQTAGAAQLRLSSTGRSQYREAEVGVHFTHTPSADFNVSYARSSARGDLNSLANYFDTISWPVVGVNAFAPLNVDAPNRLLARGRVMPSSTWLLLGVLDWRTGLPYSLVNETLDFVGPRNNERFPAYARLELGVEHRFRILKFQPWIGVRAYNALNAFLPTDVQSNISSPRFGDFYNSEYRQFRLQVRFER